MIRMRGINMGGRLSQIGAIQEKAPEKFPGIDKHIETFRDGSLTTRYATGSTINNGATNGQMPTTRYRWLGEDGSLKTTTEDGYSVQGNRYGSRGVTLYGKGEAVAVSSSTNSCSMYLGKDILGSVKTATAEAQSTDDRHTNWGQLK